MSSELTVVICSLNGATGVNRCLQALGGQTARSRLEVIVVDDGSTDETSEVARRQDAILIRHPTNRGLAAARNSGAQAASSPIVAFLDDDCEPEPKWAEEVLSGYNKGVVAVGGPILACASTGFVLGYLQRHNPLAPLELNLTHSPKLAYRLYLYLRRQWRYSEPFGLRDVYSLVGGNMSFRRSVLLSIGGFDERFRFGAEETDLCMRLTQTSPETRLVFLPEARVIHHFEASLRDVLRRSRAYGVGSARLYRKWPSVGPTVFPGPLMVVAILLMALRFPPLAVAALATPQVLYPRGLLLAITSGRPRSLLDPYVQLAQETCEDIGFVQGLWRFRHLISLNEVEAVQAVRSDWGAEESP